VWTNLHVIGYNSKFKYMNPLSQWGQWDLNLAGKCGQLIAL